MLSHTAARVLVALRDLARENSKAPSSAQLAARAGVQTSALPGLRDELVTDGLVTKVGAATVVTILGHEWLALQAAAASAEEIA